MEHTLKSSAIFIGVSLVTLLLCAAEYLVIFPLLAAFNYIESGNILEATVHVLQIMLSFVFQGAIFSLSAAIGVGICLLIVVIFCLMRKKNNWLRIFGALLVLLVFVPIISVVLMVAAVPAIIITYVASTSQSTVMFIASLVLDGITLFAMSFMVVLIGGYLSFWFPAIASFGEKAFSVSRKFVDSSFRQVAPKVLAFFLFMILSEALLLYFNYMNAAQGTGIVRFLVLFLCNWIYKSIVVTCFVIYTFLAFRSQMAK